MELRENELEKLYADTFHGVETGTVLQGKVLVVKPDSVIVDVGYKSEGIIPATEFSATELSTIKAGDLIDVYVVQIRDSEGLLVLSRERASRIKAWSSIEDKLKNNLPIEGTVSGKTKGGMFVDVMGVKAFLPGSHIDIRNVKDPDSLIGQKLLFKVLKLNSKRSSIIVSRREFIEEERLVKRVKTLEVLKEGETMKGVIKNITDYGVFVDLGGIDGLLHISDISWGRIGHPSELFKVGDEVDVLVLKYEPDHGKVTLGYKQKKADPWSTVEDKYPIGTKVGGKIVSLTDYGAFIEIEEGLEGLVHVSEIEWAPKPKHPSKYLNIGDAVEAVVIRVDKNERRLSLSIKKLSPSPWQLVSERYQPGQVISGKVRGITDFGAFVGLPEGVDGLIHISDISWTKHVKHPSELLKKGQKIDAVIISVEPEKERMALGLKQLRQDPWLLEIPDKYRLGDEIDCRVLRQTDFGVFVELDEDVEGLIYASEIVDYGEPIKENDIVRSRIIKIDLENRKIGLSMKNLRTT